jgi:hypothetical protein
MSGSWRYVPDPHPGSEPKATFAGFLLCILLPFAVMFLQRC